MLFPTVNMEPLDSHDSFNWRVDDVGFNDKTQARSHHRTGSSTNSSQGSLYTMLFKSEYRVNNLIL